MADYCLNSAALAAPGGLAAQDSDSVLREFVSDPPDSVVRAICSDREWVAGACPDVPDPFSVMSGKVFAVVAWGPLAFVRVGWRRLIGIGGLVPWRV